MANSLLEVKKNRELYASTKKLYDNAITYAREAKEAPIDSKVVLLAIAPQKLQQDLKTTASKIYLSGYTIRTHTHHDNITAFDYYLIAHMLKNVYKTKRTKNLHIVYFSKLGKYYKVVFKSVKDKDEIFVLSVVKGNNKILH